MIRLSGFFRWIGPLLLGLGLSACGGSGGAEDPTPQNQAPTLALGADPSVNEQTPVSIAANAVDTDGSVVVYAWTQTAGPSVVSSGSERLQFTAPVVAIETVLGFSLTVTNDDGASATSSIQIRVLPVNDPPTLTLARVLNADDLAPVVVSAVVADPDGSIASLAWTQTAGPAASLAGVNTADLQIEVPVTSVDATLSFTLLVTDDLGASSSASIDILLQHVNRAPTVSDLALADAGDARMLLTVAHSDPENQPLNLLVEVSTDNGASWRGARIEGDTAAGAPADADGSTLLRWDSLADLGFRQPTTATLRVSADDGTDFSPPRSLATATIDNLRAAARRLDHHAIHYGVPDSGAITELQRYQLVVLHPGSGDLDRNLVASVQAGADPIDPGDDVMVLCYVSVGEDIRTVSTPISDPRFQGDGSGPRVDPRANSYAGGLPISGIDPLGAPSPGGTGFASYYLDDNSVAQGAADGIPDANAIFGGAFVNIGDPAWYAVLDDMRLDRDGAAGLAEILSLDQGRGLGCDGLFLDTIDTAAPNGFTDENSFNQSEFEWTAAGFADFTARVKAAYPRALLLQNRGLFYYDPRFPHYAVNARADVDLLLFESYRLNSSGAETFSTSFFADNKFNFAPKIMAEANRADGFKVLSLGYAEGPLAQVSTATLTGAANVGLDLLQADIDEASQVGFRHYLTNGAIDLLNSFVFENVDLGDTQAPQWSSTFNDSGTFPPGPPTPRVGLQRIDAGGDSLTLHWDVALDLNAVDYIAYYQTQAFDFSAAEPLANATRVVLSPSPGAGYSNGVGPGVYAHQARIEGLQAGPTYHVLLRAADRSLDANEDANQIVLSASLAPTFASITVDGDTADWSGIPVALADPADVADSFGPDWLDLQLANDSVNLYLRTTSENAFNLDGSPGGFSRLLIYLDLDDDPTTGFQIQGMGADLLINGAGLFSMATGTTFDPTAIVPSGLLVEPRNAVTDLEWAIPLARIQAIAPAARQIRLLLQNDAVSDLAPDAGSLAYNLQSP